MSKPEILPERYEDADRWVDGWLKGHHSLAEARAILDDCTRCRLQESRTHLVFGKGSCHAEVMFIGEAPGQQEDRAGEPFVGPAGRMLTKMIHSIDLERESVYITNIVKSRPPKNRDPRSDEIRACSPYLKMEIGIIQPKIICTLGRIAAQTILETNDPISRLRGKVHSMGSRSVVVTYHPASFWRNPDWEKEALTDMQIIRELLKA